MVGLGLSFCSYDILFIFTFTFFFPLFLWMTVFRPGEEGK